MYKKKIILRIGILALVFVGLLIFLNSQKNLNTQTKGSSIDLTNSVIIKEGEIENEELIDSFIDNATINNNQKQELNIMQDDKHIKVIYTPGEYAKIYSSNKENGETVYPSDDGSIDSRKKVYGYYSLFIDDVLKGEYPLVSHTIKRSTLNNITTLYFDAPLIEYIEIPEICKYNFESSNYTKKFDLYFSKRKNIEINLVYETDDYSVNSFGGDVLVVIDGDMVYNLDKALEQSVITPDDILGQAQIDLKYGICQVNSYSDGGSIEYSYNPSSSTPYTILKLNTLDGNKDLVIGIGGEQVNSGNFLSMYNKYISMEEI